MVADLQRSFSLLCFVASLAVPHALFAVDGELDPFLAQFDQIESLHLKASALVSMATLEGAREGTVQIEYRESDGRYRLVSGSEPGLKLIADMETAFDGQTFQLWLRHENVLSVAREDSRVPTSAMVNPFFLPVQFLRADASIGEGAMRLADVVRAGREATAQKVDGALKFGTDFRVITAQEEGTTVPRLIQQVAGSQGGESVIELRDYRRYGRDELIFPASISVQAIDPNAGTVRTEILITALELDTALPPSTFVIIGDAETRIWNSDLERFEEASSPATPLER